MARVRAVRREEEAAALQAREELGRDVRVAAVVRHLQRVHRDAAVELALGGEALERAREHPGEGVAGEQETPAGVLEQERDGRPVRRGRVGGEGRARQRVHVRRLVGAEPLEAAGSRLVRGLDARLPRLEAGVDDRLAPHRLEPGELLGAGRQDRQRDVVAEVDAWQRALVRHADRTPLEGRVPRHRVREDQIGQLLSLDGAERLERRVGQVPPAVEPDVSARDAELFLAQEPEHAVDVVGVHVRHDHELEAAVARRERSHALAQAGLPGPVGAAVDEDPPRRRLVAELDPEGVAVPAGKHLDGQHQATGARPLAARGS